MSAAVRAMAISGVRKIARNTASLLASDATNRAATFVLYALVGRRLGAYEFGQMSLALTLFYISQVLAVAGLKTLITREVARDRSKTDLYLVNGSVIAILASMVSLAGMRLFVQAMNYSADTSTVILLLTLALLPYSLSAVCEGVFQAWEQMHYIAFASLSINVVKVAAAYLVLGRLYGLPGLIGLLIACYAAVLVVEWVLVLTRITRPRISVDLGFGLGMVRATSTFLGIDMVIAVATNINVILLSKFADETQVGVYSAASQLLVPLLLLFNSTAMSIFPVMSRRFEPTFGVLRLISERMIAVMLVIALPTLVGLFFLPDLVLGILYGNRDFTASSVVLRITVWTLISVSLTSVLGQVLLASMRERVNLRIVMIDAVATFVFSIMLISQFGLIGAAVSTLLVRAVDLAQHLLAISRLPLKLSLGGLVWRPAVAAAAMAAYLAFVSGGATILTGMAALALYAAVLAGLTVWSTGGVGQLKARFQNMQFETWAD
jgi:O-antigen/teichoic acid export membrane protein